MQNTRYAFAVTSVRVKESSLLDAAEMEQLLSATSLSDALAYLAEQGWKIPEGKHSSNRLLQEELLRSWDFIREVAPEVELFYPLLIERDYQNVKAAIKCKLSDLDLSHYFTGPTVLEPHLIVEAVQQRNFHQLPEQMAMVAEEAYDVLVRTGDGQLTDTILDQGALTDMQARAKALGNPLISQIVEFYPVKANIKIAFRSAISGKNQDFLRRAIAECQTLDKNQLINAALRGVEALQQYLNSTIYAPAVALLVEEPASFERWMDDQIMALLEKAKYQFFGPDPLIAYYLAKETEIKNLRMILATLESGLPAEKVRPRLRRIYA